MRADSGTYVAAETAHACGATIVRGDPDAVFTGISTDSRDIKKGDLFVPLTGPSFDGHDFTVPALEAGARGSLFHRDNIRDLHVNLTDIVLIQVKDTLLALTSLASAFRNIHSCPLIAVTGSSGKTTVKEMIAYILRRSHNVLASEANYNNLIGLPMTVLNLTSRHTAAVVEAGINVPGEMRLLAEAAMPDAAVITTIGPVHLEGLGSMENVAKEKFDLAKALPSDGTVVLPDNDPLLKNLMPECPAKALYFGLESGDLRVRNLSFGHTTSFTMITPAGEVDIKTLATGAHNVANALAAAGAALAIGVSLRDIREGLADFQPPKWRMEMIPLSGDRTLIRDCYNANPQSMKAALEVLARVANEAPSLALLGDMKELGEKSGKLHEKLGEETANRNVRRAIFIGEWGESFSRGFMKAGGDGERLTIAVDKDEAFDALKDELKNYEAILVKGSRAMKMETLADRILEED